MIPRLSQTPSLDPIVSAYLESLRTQNFSGDIASSYSDRLSLATDNSVYQQKPKLAPHIPAMRANIAADLGLPENCVNIKGKTNKRHNIAVECLAQSNVYW